MVYVVGCVLVRPVIFAVAEFEDRKSTRLNSSHGYISYAVFCLKKKTVLPHPRGQQCPAERQLPHLGHALDDLARHLVGTRPIENLAASLIHHPCVALRNELLRL